MRKLLATSRSLGEQISNDETDELGQTPECPIGDFSATDLIRQRIGEPDVFNETTPADTPTPTSIRVATVNEGELTSTWTIEMDPSPLSLPQNGHPRPPGGRGKSTPRDEPERVEIRTVGRIESVTDEGCANPQLTSTPNHA